MEPQPPVVPGNAEPYTLSTVMPAPSKPSRPGWVVPVVITLAVLLVAALGGIVLVLMRTGALPSLPGTASTVTVHGQLVLYDDDLGGSTTNCRGTGGYSDIHEGTQVTVSAPDGTVLAFGPLSAGTWVGRNCQFNFQIENVPAGKGIYGVSIGRRGTLQFNEDELSTALGLTLGQP